MASIAERRGPRATAGVMVLPLIQRLLFYGALYAAINYAVGKGGISIPGEPLWPFFTAVAAICGAAIAFNYTSLKSYSELEKGFDLGYWASQRLHDQADRKKQVAISRALVGSLFCLITGALAAYLRSIETDISGWVLTISIIAPVLSIVFAVLTILEGFAINRSESDLLMMQREHRDRKKISDLLTNDEPSSKK